MGQEGNRSWGNRIHAKVNGLAVFEGYTFRQCPDVHSHRA